MKEFIGEGFGKTVIIELERGEKIIESICERLKALGIKNAVVASVVGSIQKLVYHRPTELSQSTIDEFITIEEPLEICSLTGTVIDGVAHFHFTAAGPKEVYGGHLEPGSETLYLFEVTLAEIKGFELERRLTPENVKKIFKKE